jgi:glycylpeptide N-tetradecanoyltransferase
LDKNYVTDANGNFLVGYSIEKLRWAAASPGWVPELHTIIRNTTSKKIMATALSVPKKFMINGQAVKMVEGNFLCIHKKLREKRLAQIMLQEQMRRQRAMGYPQACYTSGHAQPTPACTNYYMNKFLNPSKLVEVKYCFLPNNMTFKQFEKKHHLTDSSFINLKGTMRLMEMKDVDTVFKL